MGCRLRFKVGSQNKLCGRNANPLCRRLTQDSIIGAKGEVLAGVCAMDT